MNFTVEWQKGVRITQKSSFGELCGTPDSVMVAPQTLFMNLLDKAETLMPMLDKWSFEMKEFLAKEPQTAGEMVVTY